MSLTSPSHRSASHTSGSLLLYTQCNLVLRCRLHPRQLPLCHQHQGKTFHTACHSNDMLHTSSHTHPWRLLLSVSKKPLSAQTLSLPARTKSECVAARAPCPNSPSSCDSCARTITHPGTACACAHTTLPSLPQRRPSPNGVTRQLSPRWKARHAPKRTALPPSRPDEFRQGRGRGTGRGA